jgi:hypothetical protein
MPRTFSSKDRFTGVSTREEAIFKEKSAAREKEIAAEFDGWLKGQEVQEPLNLNHFQEMMFQAYHAGADTEIAPIRDETPLSSGRQSLMARGDVPDDDLAFPPITEGMPIIQYRPYSDLYNEDKYKVGNRVLLLKSEHEDVYDEDSNKVRGEIVGIRIARLSELHKQHQAGILRYYSAKDIDLSGGTVFVFWVWPTVEVAWGSESDWHEEVYDITDV